MLEVEKIRKDFFILNSSKKTIYFDNACMSLKPNSVLSAMQEYYQEYSACAGRSAHQVSLKVSQKIKEARQEIAEFINAQNENEIIFTRNTTEGINLLAHGLNWQKGDIVLLSDKEHNSNLIPWLRLKKEKEIEIRIVPSKEDNTFDLEKFQEMVSGAKLVSIVHTSNLDGATNPALEIIQLAHKAGALVFLDVAQSIAHQPIDVRILDVDFLAFSGHKILGPTGTGIFYGKINLLAELKPFMVGGDTVEFSTYTDYQMLPVPQKFEAGLQDYAGIIGLAEAIKYIKRIGYQFIQEQEKELNTYITNELLKIPQIKIIGPVDANLRSGIINFYLEEMDVHQLATMLDQMEGICIRSGQHCVHAWFQNKKIKNSARVSLYFYNTKAEAEIFINSLNKIMKIVS